MLQKNLIRSNRIAFLEFSRMSSKKKLEKQQKKEQATAQPVTCSKTGDIIIKILVKPGAKLNSITDISPEGVGVQINAPPVDGEANAELVKYLSSVLGVRKSDVSLEKGSRSRTKTVTVTNTQQMVEQVVDKLTTEKNSGH